MAEVPHGNHQTSGALTHWLDTWPMDRRAIAAMRRCFGPNIVLALYRDEHSQLLASQERARQSTAERNLFMHGRMLCASITLLAESCGRTPSWDISDRAEEKNIFRAHFMAWNNVDWWKISAGCHH